MLSGCPPVLLSGLFSSFVFLCIVATLLFDDRYYDYDFGPGHPFSPVRQRMTIDLLDALGHPIEAASPPVASREDIRRVHDEEFVDAVEAAGADLPPGRARKYGLNTGDVPIFPGMDDATRGLVGGTLHGARLLASGDAHRVLQMGGGLHHAHEERASGFCVYNDLSVAIEYLREQRLRVAYLDIDVHHGDGVQFLHYDDPDVLTVSLHETGAALFPGTGDVNEIGNGAGTGYAVNVPLAPFTQSESYLDAFDRVVPYVIDRFEPDVLVAQCGADAHFRDPLADLMLTTHAYESLFREIVDLAGEHCQNRLLCTLGGGYHLDAVPRIWALLALIIQGFDLPETIPQVWIDRWQSELEDPLTETFHDSKQTFEISRHEAIRDKNERTSKQVLEQIAPHWY